MSRYTITEHQIPKGSLSRDLLFFAGFYVPVVLLVVLTLRNEWGFLLSLAWAVVLCGWLFIRARKDEIARGRS